jgi:hypothetical protein
MKDNHMVKRPQSLDQKSRKILQISLNLDLPKISAKVLSPTCAIPGLIAIRPTMEISLTHYTDGKRISYLF